MKKLHIAVLAFVVISAICLAPISYAEVRAYKGVDTQKAGLIRQVDLDTVTLQVMVYDRGKGLAVDGQGVEIRLFNGYENSPHPYVIHIIGSSTKNGHVTAAVKKGYWYIITAVDNGWMTSNPHVNSDGTISKVFYHASNPAAAADYVVLEIY